MKCVLLSFFIFFMWSFEVTSEDVFPVNEQGLGKLANKLERQGLINSAEKSLILHKSKELKQKDWKKIELALKKKKQAPARSVASVPSSVKQVSSEEKQWEALENETFQKFPEIKQNIEAVGNILNPR